MIIANDEWDICYCIANSDNTAKNIKIKWLSYKTSLLYRNIIFTLKNNSWSCNVIKRELTDGLTADIYKSALETSIQMPNTVGGIAAGTTVATLNGKKQNQIIDMLLFPEQQPQVVAPSATILLSSGFINNEIMEVGMAAPVAGTNIKTAFNQGYGRVAGQPDKKRAGALNSEASFIYCGGQESNKTLPTKVVLGTMQYNYHATYAQGEQLVTSWGNIAKITSADYSGWKRVDGGGVTQTVVENVLTSTSTTHALSAAQGKVLNDSKLNKTDVVNNLTTPDASKALSAAQGKALSDKINGLGNVYKYKGTKPTISEVIAITNAVVGDVYNVEAEFSVGGKKYPAGTNVACIKNTSTTEHTEANWDPLGGTVDLSAYATKAEMNSGLNGKINTSAIKNDLTTGGVTNVLSAE